jgi:tetratricopeptide (TPR) repeat protein
MKLVLEITQYLTKSDRMRHKVRDIIALITVISVLSGCSILRKSDVRHQTSDIRNQREKDEVTGILIDGKREEITGNYDNASSLFQKCISKDPNDAACKYELANLYLLKKNFTSAISLLKEAEKTEPENEWYRLQLAKTYEMSQQTDNAVKEYENLIKLFPDRFDFYYSLASVYISKRKYSEAIKVYNELENKAGLNEDISMQKKNLYLNLNKLDKAVNEIQKLIDRYPSETKYYNLKADIYLVNKMPDKAYEIYRKILLIAPDDPNVHLSLAEYYRVKGDNQKSFEELKTAFSNNKLNIDSKISIMLSYYLVTENYNELKDQAYMLAEILVNNHPNEPKAYAVYGDFLFRDKKYKEARDIYHKVISLDSSQYNVWEQLLYLESELKDYNLLKKESNEAIELFPLQPIPYLMNADANFKMKNFNKAIESLKKGSEVAIDNDDLLVQFYSYLGDAYNELKKYNTSDSSYEKALLIKPDDEGVLNNYAYFLSLRNERLGKAEEMAGKAVELKPDIPSYLDTYGWVLYKEGKYDKAKIMIEKAIDKGGSDNDIILEHYGDIMYKTGHIEKAMEYWNKAREAGKGSEMLEKKITEGKLYE